MPARSLVARMLFTALAVAITESPAMSAEPAEAERVALTQRVVQANTAFGLDLYAKLRAGSDGNLFLSPYSISTALAMTYAGARGETATEMAKVLQFALPSEQLERTFAALTADLNVGKQGYQLRIANRLWGQTGYTFLRAFLHTTREYGAELEQVDFARSPEPARHTINAWVEEKTAQKIRDLIAPGVLDRRTTLVLTNAVYFKGDWQSKFEAEATRDARFMVTPQKPTTVPMMHQRGQFPYGVAGDVEILELPYAGKDLSLVVLLPRKTDGLADLEKRLTPKSLAAWTSELRQREIEVYLPKFKTASAFRLDQVLSSMGMPSAFSDHADFSGMDGKRDLFISAIVHKAFVDVNEEGTEAAAATGVVMSRMAVMVTPTFRADHPFLFLIRDNRTGSVLFLGRIVNPTE